ncbi:MAG: AMP-dependent synthetase/ligase [Propionibacteriaceae bacterium]
MSIARYVPLPVAFRAAAAAHPHDIAWRIRAGDDWKQWTFSEAIARVDQLSCAFIEHGVAAGDRVAIFAPNRPEWSLADWATLSVGAITVTVFATCNVDQAQHILKDSGATVCVVAGQREADIIAACDLPELGTVVSMDPVAGLETLESWEAKALDVTAIVNARTAALTLDDIATIIYSSGTTGASRGAMITHRSFDHQMRVIDDHWHLGPGESSVAFLPLAHALERDWSFYMQVCGGMITYCENPRTIADTLVTARPTTLISVPKLYEKIYAGAYEKVADSPIKKAVFEWALRIGGRCQHLYRKGRTPSLLLRGLLKIADAAVLANIREAVGGKKTLLISGGAPLRREIEEFFSAAGMLLGQGYGLTETGPMTTVISSTSFKIGTVGRLVPEAELRVGLDGEILLKGPHITKGYWNNPEATAQAFDAEGWFHTGDVGYVDTQGYVVITDRLKDIIVTEGGKNIAPQAIEGLLLADSLFEYAVVIGDNRPYLTALVQPSIAGLEALARQIHVTWSSAEDLVTNPALLDVVKERVAALQERLPGFEQIRDIRLMRGLSIDEGTVTPTLKVRRASVEAKFADLIEEMYAKKKRH